MYYVIRRMRDHYQGSVAEKLRAMGRRMGDSYAEAWVPKERELQRVLKEIYGEVLNSKIRVEYDKPSGTLKVIDKKCALCKYPKEGIDEAGCEIVVGFVEGLIARVQPIRNLSWKLKAVGVEKTPVRGDSYCEQVFSVEGA